MLNENEAAELARLMRDRDRHLASTESREPLDARLFRVREMLVAAFGDDADSSTDTASVELSEKP